MVAILVAFGGFGTWAAIAPLASAAIAPGVVTVDSNHKKVQHLEGGIIKTLLVRDGDKVKAGDVLVQLDETQPQASLAILQTKSDAARALEARLLAERDDAAEIEFADDLLKRRVDPNVAELLSGQETLFEARRNALKGETIILESRIEQLKNDIAGVRAQQKAKEHQIELVEDEARSLQKLLQKGYVGKPRYLALEREVARLEGERGEHISEIAQANTKIGETKLQIIQLWREFQEKVADELRSIQADILDLKERIRAAQHVLEHIEIRAPVSGSVVGMAVHTVGGVIKAGETVLDIVPVDDRLIIEARVQPQDIDNVHIGQEANIRFTAFKRRNTPSLVGHVSYISADRIVDSRTGEAYYKARLAVSDNEVARLGDKHLQPGMPAEVMIKTGEGTAIEYLARPFLDSLERAWREE
ncbi:Type I secretion membrane fusion protein, HlyD [Nitrococcus mobilis Nb-231]|uniref:Membrane fusion protein (MFP) family protein n=1 Tax=Nitrococcus mobilis Nb-231 TaxID=314278 RepID=A4BQQ5_9GAMM|nr:Type I secretion membrane fusion protein, HlyD [Nitrococcus mobilis Nb-231]